MAPESQQTSVDDSMSSFRRRLQQLGEGRDGAVSATLADLFPLDTLMSLNEQDGNGNEEDDDEHGGDEHDDDEHDDDDEQNDGHDEEHEDLRF